MAGITDCCGLASYVDGSTIVCNSTTGKLESPATPVTCVTTDFLRNGGNGVANIDVTGPSGVDVPLGDVTAVTYPSITNPLPCQKRLRISGVNGNLTMYVTNVGAGGVPPHSLSFGLEVSLDGGALYRKVDEMTSVWDPVLAPFQQRSVHTYKRSHLVLIGPGATITPLWRCSYSNLGAATDAARIIMTTFDFEWEIL